MSNRLKCCKEHGSITDVLRANFQMESTTDVNELDERDYARFEFKMRFGWILDIAQGP